MVLQWQCQVWLLCFRKELLIYEWLCTYLWRALFQSMVSERGIGIATSIFGLVLNAFWKRALHIFIINVTEHWMEYWGMNNADSMVSQFGSTIRISGWIWLRGRMRPAWWWWCSIPVGQYYKDPNIKACLNSVVHREYSPTSSITSNPTQS